MIDNVRSVASGADTSVWLFEVDAELVHFSADGTFIERVRRKGEGPGESRRFLTGHVDPQSGVIAVAGPGGSLIVLSPTLTEIRRYSLLQRYPIAPRDVVVEAGGEAVWNLDPLRADTVQGPGGAIALVTSVHSLVRYSSRGVDTIRTVTGRQRFYPREGGSTSQVMSGQAVLSAADTLGVLVGSGHTEYRIQLLSYPDGVVRHTYTRALRASPVERDLVRLTAERMSRITGADVPLSRVPPSSSGYVDNALFDVAGQRVFVCRVTHRDLDYQLVDVFTVTGAYVGSLKWDSCPIHIDRIGQFYFSRRDSLGVEFVDIHTLEAESS